MTDESQIVFQVPYQKGTLKVIAKNNGKAICEKEFKSAGEAVGLKLNVDRQTVKANRTDVIQVEVSVVDVQGTMLPDAANLINFEVSGPARIIGVENGDILDLSPHKVNYRKAFKGKCLLLLQTTAEAGNIEVKATAKGLQEEAIRISSAK